MKEIWYIKKLDRQEYYNAKYWDSDTWSRDIRDMSEWGSREKVIEAIEVDMNQEYPRLSGTDIEILSYIQIPYKD